MIGFAGKLKNFNKVFAIFITGYLPRTLLIVANEKYKRRPCMIFVSCGNSSSLATRQPQSFSSSYPLTNISTSTFFNCKKMTILLLKYNCALREDGTIVSTYGEFSEYLLEEIFDIVGNKPTVFLFRFIFITVYNSRVITAQLFIVRNIKRHKVLIREKSLFRSNVRRSYQILYILTLMVNLYFENYLFVKL